MSNDASTKDVPAAAEHIAQADSIEVQAAAVPATEAATNAPAEPARAPPANPPHPPTEQQQQAQNPQQQQQQQPQQQQQGANQQNASLYVGELDPDVSEAMLFEIFAMIGPVASIRICRDAVTRRSLGYAYVNFLSSRDGERALETLNYSLIKNSPCRIMWSQRDPAARKSGSGNVFIKNLETGIDNKALHDTFASFGTVLSSKVATDEFGRSKGYGFVHYETLEAAKLAVQHVNGMLLNDKKVFVGLHISRKERQSKIDEGKAQFTNVFVKNIDEAVTEAEFQKMAGKFGKTTSCVLSKKDDGTSKGFGFVNYEDHEHAAAAVEGLNNKEVNGKPLWAGRAQKKAERDEELRKSHAAAQQEKMSKYAGVNLYVKNLEEDCDDEKLRKEFEPYGTITSCKIMRDDKGVSKNFGFVCFSTPDEATKAVSELSGKMIGSKPLYVSLAQQKDARAQQLANQMAQRNQMRMQVPGGMPMPPYGMPPMFYPGPGGFPPPGRGMMYPPQGNYPPRMRPYGPGQGQPMPGMPMPAGPYQGMPQGYMPQQGYRGNGRPPQQRGGNGPQGNARGASNMSQRGAAPYAAAAAQAPAQDAGDAAQQAPVEQGSKLDLAALAKVDPEEQKQLIGEQIYGKVLPNHPDEAGKITGMLLEMDNARLLELLDDDAALQGHVQATLEELRKAAPEKK